MSLYKLRNCLDYRSKHKTEHENKQERNFALPNGTKICDNPGVRCPITRNCSGSAWFVAQIRSRLVHCSVHAWNIIFSTVRPVLLHSQSGASLRWGNRADLTTTPPCRGIQFRALLWPKRCGPGSKGECLDDDLGLHFVWTLDLREFGGVDKPRSIRHRSATPDAALVGAFATRHARPEACFLFPFTRNPRCSSESKNSPKIFGESHS